MRACLYAKCPWPSCVPVNQVELVSHAGELGNLNLERLTENYEGVALSLVDALSTLAVMGNASEFSWAVQWLSANVRPPE